MLPIRSAQDVQGEVLGQFTRKVLFAPSLGNSQYIRMAVVTAPPGARVAVHTHPGNEALFFLQGEVTYVIRGQKHVARAGEALMIPPATEHSGVVTSDVPLSAIGFFCDECALLKTYRARGGALKAETPRVVRAADIAPEPLGELKRRVLFTPSRDGVNFLRCAFIEGPVGARGAVHTHPGNECAYMITGQVMLRIGGDEHRVNAGQAIMIPPATEHPLTVTGQENYSAIAAYCDDCPLIKEK